MNGLSYASCEVFDYELKLIGLLFQYVVEFGKGTTIFSFWENVYGFNMKCVGDEVVHDATNRPIIDVVDNKIYYHYIFTHSGNFRLQSSYVFYFVEESSDLYKPDHEWEVQMFYALIN